jgi:hypothetical protein
MRSSKKIHPGKSSTSADSATSPHTKSQQNTSFLRLLLLITLTLTGVATGGLCYYFIRSSQIFYDIAQFEGKIHDHFQSTKNAFNLQLQANIAVSTALATTCPHASQWPNCKIPSHQLMSRTGALSTMTGVIMFTIGPIVRPENRKSFEKFAVNNYATDGGYPQGAGHPFSIFEFDGVSRTRAPNHTDLSKQRRDILVPILYNTLPLYDFFLIDTYRDLPTGPTVDEILDCVNNKTSSSPSDHHHSCSTITDFFGSYSAIATPIIPPNDPDTVVGVAAAVFSWETLFSTAAQQNFDFQCSVQSDSSPLIQTFVIKNGIARATTSITHSTPSTDGFWKQSKHSFTLNPEGILVNETKYTMTYYSSNNAPSVIFAAVAGVSCLGITFVISMIFVIFNALMAREALQASMLLDSKRTYVRFVSHEIRLVISSLFLYLLLSICSHSLPTELH